MRIGHGYDVHRTKEGRALVLGGVTIDCPFGLDGHSDADVLTHAVIDALLGAAALGDIGKLFPDTDQQYKGINSLILLERAYAAVQAAGYRLGNLDSTILCQRPKLAPSILAMRENLARILGVDVDDVSVKATTEEKLGFTGSGEGIAAHAVCLLERI
ncbi:MAG: 2-C-methyl-D-erythritol 2,4-cyclodiphosphate synthase [Clostridia bacterium]|nr:2-C-methyl-D-erythritol 2,4-cyclodiphosphate synthase [Clostridia bacterium]